MIEMQILDRFSDTREKFVMMADWSANGSSKVHPWF
jgi:hypothetical protein